MIAATFSIELEQVLTDSPDDKPLPTRVTDLVQLRWPAGPATAIVSAIAAACGAEFAVRP